MAERRAVSEILRTWREILAVYDGRGPELDHIQFGVWLRVDELRALLLEAERARAVCHSADRYADCAAEFGPDAAASCGEVLEGLETAVIAWRAVQEREVGDAVS